jgi:hypothetical protein
MKRYLMIVLAVLPATLLITIVALGTPGILGTHTPTTHDQVSSAIDSYLQYRAPKSRSINSMSKATFGNGNYFKSEFHSTSIPLMWLGQKPLPYPPAAVWCVRLRPAGHLYPEIVFVAEHEDDYHMEWIVHDPAAENSTELAAELATLGCSEVEQP